jgi:hypothetical protein
MWWWWGQRRGGVCGDGVYCCEVHFLRSHVLVHGKCTDVSDEPTASILRIFQLALCVYLIKQKSCVVYFNP